MAWGYGKFTNENGDIYECEWLNSMINGNGLYHSLDGSYY